MTAKTKNQIRATVAAALLAWPVVETCRLVTAVQDLSISQQQQKAVMLRLAQVQSLQMAAKPAQP